MLSILSIIFLPRKVTRLTKMSVVKKCFYYDVIELNQFYMFVKLSVLSAYVYICLQ